MTNHNRFIVVPADNVFNHEATTASFELQSSLSRLGLGKRARRTNFDEAIGSVRVIDSVDLNDATLVEMDEDQAMLLQQRYPSLRIAPEVRLEMCVARLSSRIKDRRLFESDTRSVELSILSEGGIAVANAEVEILVSADDRLVLDGLASDANGVVRFEIPADRDLLEMVYIVPRAGFWPAGHALVPVDPEAGRLDLHVSPIVAGHDDALDVMHGAAGDGTGKGVKIAVIDGGASLPDDPLVVRRLNYVIGEDEGDVSDNGTGHGTHVAGILRRIAPEAEILVYRVCGKNSRFANETAIAKAMRDAVDDGCDLINLSIGQDSEPLAITRQTRRARSQGCVVVAAAGNRWGDPVEYPARTPGVLAVSACGVAAAAPVGAVMADISATPPHHVDGLFFAQFSNIGDEIDVIAPGVAILSPVSPTEIGCMDGTSMACPAIVGLAARLLSGMEELMSAERDQQRSDDIIRALLATAQEVGFGREREGFGKLTV